MKVCELKNGSKNVPYQAISSLMMTLSYLKHNNQSSLCELAKKAHDPNYKITNPESTNTLINLGLLGSDGALSNPVKNIAQSAISIEDGVPIIGGAIVQCHTYHEE